MGVGLLMLVPPLLTIPIVPTAKPVVVSSNVTSSTPRPQEPGLGRSAAISRQQDSGLPATTAPTSPGQPAAEAWRVVPWLLGLCGVGVAVLAVRIALAWFGLNRIISRAQEAPAQVVEECRDVAESIGSPAVRVVCSTEIATPCLAGIRRPVLLLPARELANDDLRSVGPRPRTGARPRPRSCVEPRRTLRDDRALVPPARLAAPLGPCGCL